LNLRAGHRAHRDGPAYLIRAYACGIGPLTCHFQFHRLADTGIRRDATAWVRTAHRIGATGDRVYGSIDTTARGSVAIDDPPSVAPGLW